MEFLEPTCQAFVERRGLKYAGCNPKLKSVARWLVGGRDSLLINGSVGVGKTTIGKAVCHMLNKLGKATNIYETYAPDVLRHCYDDDFHRIKTTDVLFVDDFGIECIETKLYGNLSTPLLDILYYRYEKKLPVIMTSNLTTELIKQKYGERLLDRMRESYDVVSIVQSSYRIRASGEY